MSAPHPVGNVAVLMAAVHPWRVLRAHPEWRLHFAFLPDGLRGFSSLDADGTADIYLDSRLGRVDRNATLDHEQKHLVKGITGDERWDERGIAEASAADLVPQDDLAAMYVVAMTNDLTVEVWQVAEKFDVPHHVAELRMRMFLANLHAA